jgi:hypothetical protein
MELLAVRLARILAFVSTEELNPRGLYVLPSLAQGLVERYGFLNYPQKNEDYDEQKGIKFEDGRWHNIAIDRVAIFSNGVAVDTRSSTDDSEKILNEAMAWAVDSFGLAYKPEMVTRRIFVSELVFSTKVSLNGLNPALKGLGDRIAKVILDTFGQKSASEVGGLAFTYDIQNAKIPIAPLRIERLEDTPFEENKFYSIAPLRTNQHIEFLNDFEAALKG